MMNYDDYDTNSTGNDVFFNHNLYHSFDKFRETYV